MSVYFPALRALWVDIFPASEKVRTFSIVCLLLLLISIGLTILIGPYSLCILLLIPLVYGLFQYGIFPLCFVLAVTPFVMHWYWDYFLIFTIIANIFITIIWIARITLRQDEALVFSRQLIIFSIVFLFIGLLSCLYNGMTAQDLRVLVRFIILFPAIFAIYALIRPRDLIIILVSMTVPLIYAGFSVLSDYKDVRGPIALFNIYRLKPGGILPSANLLGNLVVVAFPLWVAIGIWHKKRIIKGISILISIILFVFLILSNSRAAMFGGFLSLIYLFHYAKKLKYFIVAIALLGVVVYSMPSARNMVLLGLRMEHGTTGRDVIWENSLNMIAKNIWLGIGLGNYQFEYDKYFKTAQERGFAKAVPNAHNLIIDLITKIGILGLFIGGALYYLPLREGIKAIRKMKIQEDRGMVYGVIASLIGLFGWSLFEAGGILSDGRFYTDIFFWIMFIVLLKINHTYQEPVSNVFFKNVTALT
jgi:O-antigen ligase